MGKAGGINPPDMRNHNLRIIKDRRTYTPQEIADLLDVRRGSIYRWVDDGLKPIRSDTNPLLFYGDQLKAFLSKRRQDHRVKLQPGEFYCLRCHEAKRVDLESVRTEKTGKLVGKDNREQLQEVANCGDCGSIMRRFIPTSPKRIN